MIKLIQQALYLGGTHIYLTPNDYLHLTMEARMFCRHPFIDICNIFGLEIVVQDKLPSFVCLVGVRETLQNGSTVVGPLKGWDLETHEEIP